MATINFRVCVCQRGGVGELNEPTSDRNLNQFGINSVMKTKYDI